MDEQLLAESPCHDAVLVPQGGVDFDRPFITPLPDTDAYSIEPVLLRRRNQLRLF